MSELIGMQALKSKLERKKTRVNLRYKYYEQKYVVKDYGISTPPRLTNKQTVLGWCTKSVDALSARLVFKGFKNDIFEIEEIFNMNNPDTFFESAINSALICSCSFVYIYKNEGEVSLEVIDGANATGVIDVKTGFLKEGYAILDSTKEGKILAEAYFTPEYTEYHEIGKEPYQINNPAGYTLLVPVIFMPSDKRPFGHSRISRACMDIVQGACRTIKRSEISAEFYSFPQKYIVGTSPDSEGIEKWKATMSAMLKIDKDEDGDKPTIGQFQQQSMSPHLDQFQMYVKQFCGETGLTADDLGFVSTNPSSADSIKAGHETLKLTARKAQKTFGRAFLNVGFIARCLADEYPYRRSAVYSTVPMWYPAFEPDASSLSSMGDGAIKFNNAVPGYFNKDNLEELTGIPASELDPIESGEK